MISQLDLEFSHLLYEKSSKFNKVPLDDILVNIYDVKVLDQSIIISIHFFIGILHMLLVGFAPTTSPFIPLLWEEEVPFDLKLIGHSHLYIML